MLSLWEEQVGRNLSACHRCPRRQPAQGGKAACGVDGADILCHGEEGSCPLGLHVAPPARGLGDTVARWAEAIGANRAVELLGKITGKDCGCKRRQEKLNAIVPYGDRREDKA